MIVAIRTLVEALAALINPMAAIDRLGFDFGQIGLRIVQFGLFAALLEVLAVELRRRISAWIEDAALLHTPGDIL